jgi:hypothetical protein
MSETISTLAYVGEWSEPGFVDYHAFVHNGESSCHEHVHLIPQSFASRS